MVVIIDVGAEQVYPPVWTTLTIMRSTLAAIISVLYFVYLGFAAGAVHRWRKEKQERVRLRVKGNEEGQVLTAMPSSASNGST